MPQRHRPLSINLSIVNSNANDSEDTDNENNCNDGRSSHVTSCLTNDTLTSTTTFRHDGLSIGRDYLRIEGSTVKRFTSRSNDHDDDDDSNQPQSQQANARPIQNKTDYSHQQNTTGEQQQSDGRHVPLGLEEWLNPSSLDLERTIGRGACSKVVRAVSRVSKRPYALKQFRVHHDTDRQRMLSKEVRTLARVDCETLVRFHGAYYADHAVTLVLEYMDRGSLDGFLESRRQDMMTANRNNNEPLVSSPLSEPVVASIGYQLLWGLAYLHFDTMIHRDVKPANVLLHSSGHVKLSDFGILSNDGHELHTTVVGTTKYMAPERLRAKPYTGASDIWSAGLVICECASNAGPFADIESMVSSMHTLLHSTFILSDWLVGLG